MFLIQNLTRCKETVLKSAFQNIFLDSRWIIIKVLPTPTNNVLVYGLE